MVSFWTTVAVWCVVVSFVLEEKKSMVVLFTDCLVHWLCLLPPCPATTATAQVEWIFFAIGWCQSTGSSWKNMGKQLQSFQKVFERIPGDVQSGTDVAWRNHGIQDVGAHHWSTGQQSHERPALASTGGRDRYVWGIHVDDTCFGCTRCGTVY